MFCVLFYFLWLRVRIEDRSSPFEDDLEYIIL